MEKRKSNLLFLVISIIVIVIVIVVGLKLTVSKDGAVTKAVEDEKAYNDLEVVEELNLSIRKKYIDIYKETSENNIPVDHVYNSDLVLSKFEEEGFIEKYKETTESGDELEVKDKFYIKVENLKMDITSGTGANGSGRNIYVIEKNQETGEHIVKFYTLMGEVREVGKLDFTPEV